MSAAAVSIGSLAPLLATGVLAFLLDAFALRKSALAVVCAGTAVSGAVSVAAFVAGTPVASAWGVLRVGGPFATASAVIALLGLLAIAGGWSELSRSGWGGSAAGLMAFAAAASITVASTSDLTLLLVGLETAAACAYALVALGRSSTAREAAMKYFVQGTIATGLLVFGIAVLVTSVVPRGGLDGLGQALAASALPVPTIGAAILLVMAALAFKAGAAPLHSWAPDAYQSASPESAAFLAAGPKIAAVIALAVLAELATSGRLQLPLSASLALLAVASVLVGSVTALRQRAYTRMLGYAGVAQVGYALVAIATTHVTSVPAFFIATYGLASTGTFLAAAAFRRVDPAWDGSIEGLAGMARRAPLLSAATALLVVSLAGIPPLLGFWAKFFVFVGAFSVAASAFASGGSAGSGWLYVVTASVGVVGSVISLGYYGAVLRALYARPDEARDAADDATELRRGGTATAAVVTAAVLVVLLGLVPLWTGVPRLWALFS